MKKLLLPLIILLLIIGYFMTQKSDDSTGDAYDKLEQPKSESMDDSGTVPEPDVDTTMPQDSDDVAPITDDPQTSDNLIDEAKDAAEDTGDALKDAAEDAGDTLKDAAEDAGDALKDAGEATKDAAQDAMDKIDGDEPKDDEQQ